jgi:alpha-tubulin suppressor-like RCC1 family protein
MGCSTPSATTRAVSTVPLQHDELSEREGELLVDIRQVSAGALHTCALRTDGAVLCWGDNTVGQLGDGSRTGKTAPVRVRGLPPARWIAAGASGTCAATLDGALYCWGANSVGQCGNGEQANGYALPVRVATLEDASEPARSPTAERTCAITEHGTIACWGRLASAGEDGRPLLSSPTPELATNVAEAVQVTVGSTHECALSGSGIVYCRGLGVHGELGIRERETTDFTPVPGIDRAVSIAAGATHTCAARADGALYCWGRNDRGQLGLRGVSHALSPTRVDLPLAVRTVVAGVAHTCALDELGGVTCFGEGARAEDERGPSWEPRTMRLETRAEDVASGAAHACALLFGGEVRCWGDNVGGQLGDGTAGDDRRWPVAVLDTRAPGEWEPTQRDTWS